MRIRHERDPLRGALMTAGPAIAIPNRNRYRYRNGYRYRYRNRHRSHRRSKPSDFEFKARTIVGWTTRHPA